MVRQPEYDRDEVLARAAVLFGRIGYEACSVGDLVDAVGVHRGSLYKGFGSKRGLFLAALQYHAENSLARLADDIRAARAAETATKAAHSDELDLLLVASLEAAAGDESVTSVVSHALTRLGDAWLAGPDRNPELDEVSSRTAGLVMLACRLAQRCLPADEIPLHLTRFQALF